jgi:hypothetical protein
VCLFLRQIHSFPYCPSPRRAFIFCLDAKNEAKKIKTSRKWLKMTYCAKNLPTRSFAFAKELKQEGFLNASFVIFLTPFAEGRWLRLFNQERYVIPPAPAG